MLWFIQRHEWSSEKQRKWLFLHIWFAECDTWQEHLFSTRLFVWFWWGAQWNGTSKGSHKALPMAVLYLSQLQQIISYHRYQGQQPMQQWMPWAKEFHHRPFTAWSEAHCSLPSARERLWISPSEHRCHYKESIFSLSHSFLSWQDYWVHCSWQQAKEKNALSSKQNHVPASGYSHF